MDRNTGAAGGAPNRTAAASDGAASAPADDTTTATGPGGTITVIGGLAFEPEELTAKAAPVVAAVNDFIGFLKPRVPAPFWSPMRFRDAKADAPEFIGTMGTTQGEYGPVLGTLQTDPKAMQRTADMALAAKDIMKPIGVLTIVLVNIVGFSLSAGMKDARIVYRRAVAAAATNSDIADAISRFRNFFVRVGKKAADTRKKKAKAKATPPAPTPAPVSTPHGNTTTVTTSQG